MSKFLIPFSHINLESARIQTIYPLGFKNISYNESDFATNIPSWTVNWGSSFLGQKYFSSALCGGPVVGLLVTGLVPSVGLGVGLVGLEGIVGLSVGLVGLEGLVGLGVRLVGLVGLGVGLGLVRLRLRRSGSNERRLRLLLRRRRSESMGGVLPRELWHVTLTPMFLVHFVLDCAGVILLQELRLVEDLLQLNSVIVNEDPLMACLRLYPPTHSAPGVPIILHARTAAY